MKGILRLLAMTMLVFVFAQCKEDLPDEPVQTVFQLSKSEFWIEKEASSVDVEITTNLEQRDWKMDQGSVKWLMLSKKTGTDGKQILSVKATANTGSEMRVATVNFMTSEGEALGSLSVKQDGNVTLAAYGDKKVSPVSATASEAQSGSEIKNSYDGDINTLYHSRWGGSTKFPVSLTYNFSGDDVINYLVYNPRNDGNDNGNFGEVAIYLATDAGKTLKLFKEIDFGFSGSSRIIEIPGGLKPTAVKFEVKTGKNNVAACAEMEFFSSSQTSALEEQLLTVFKDITCTELKDGVTDEQIQKLDPYFHKTALMLKSGEYDPLEKSFRIRSYKPYSDNEVWAKKLITRRYTHLDNPTGIAVNEGDEVVVCVGDTHGYEISLMCIWEEQSGDHVQTAAFGPTYPLREGVNILKMKTQGQLFLIYKADLTSPNAKPITLHFPFGSGKVTGFFDINEHKTDAEYAKLMAKASHKYFCMRGNKAILYFHRMKLPSRIVEGVTLWDDIVGWQHELMGIEDVWGSQFNNHIFAISPEGSFMWATDYRIAFVYTVLNTMLSREEFMKEGNEWGPAHELGHVNQIAIDWPSCSESSNNLFSNYVKYKFGKYKSRGKGLNTLAYTRFVDGRAWYNMGSGDYMNEDTEIHARMNWQLFTYFHRVGVMPDFWPKLFKEMRASGNDSYNDPGKKQLLFARNACKVSGLDLSDFFELWGFFVPVNATLEQYGTYQYTVTQAMINETKAYMAQFPKPKHPLQYIEDRTTSDFQPSDERYKYAGDLGHFNTYKSNPKLASDAQVVVSGKTVSTRNCDNAVAIEIRKNSKDGELVYFANFKTFTVPDAIKTTGCAVCAVQADGTRVELGVM